MSTSVNTAVAAILCAAMISLGGCASQPAVDDVDPTTAFGNQLGAISYTVKRGDNLLLIAADMTHERDNWRLIADFNRIINPAAIKVGQTLYIPRDLIPLDRSAQQQRAVTGSTDGVVRSVRPVETITRRPLPE